jgi:VIT1/CCC1 family predicted Fe2+/Mn2+ transporter
MGTGEYISVTNQNELVHSEVALEGQMLGLGAVAEREELAGYFREYGADERDGDPDGRRSVR